MRKLIAPLVGAFFILSTLPGCASFLGFTPYDPNAPIVQEVPQYNQQHSTPAPRKHKQPPRVVVPQAPVVAPAPVVVPVETPRPVVVTVAPPKPAPVIGFDAALTTIGGGFLIAIALALIGFFVSNFYRGFMAARKGKQ